MNASALQLIGMLAACGGAAAALLTRDPRRRHAALCVALIAAPVLVAGDVWNQSRFVDIRHHPLYLAAAVVLVAAVLAGLAALFSRYPDAFPVLTIAALPLRLPVHIGGQTSNLLLPLYGLIAAEALRRAWVLYRAGRSVSREGGGTWRASALGTWLLRLLAATLVLYAIQSAYSEDVSNAIENAGFFLVPFAVMLCMLLDVDWTPRLLGRVLLLVGAATVAMAALAYWEYLDRHLVLNTQLLDENQLHIEFRVNSIFHDPNIFGRYLALVIVALTAYVVSDPPPRAAFAGTGVGVVALGALALTFSLSSFAALLAGLVIVAWLRWRLTVAIVLAGAILVAGGVYFLVSGNANRDLGSQQALNKFGEGRVQLVRGGITLAEDRPVWGWGSGAFGAAFERHIKRANTTASHSEPITVGAEQGIIGLAVYLALLAVSLALLLTGPMTAGRIAVAACYVAMIVHSLGYAGFTIDPATWALLALGLALSPAFRRAPA